MDTIRLGHIDYVLLVIYMIFVLGIGFALKRFMKTSTDFFLSGRSIPAWITALAFVSAVALAAETLKVIVPTAPGGGTDTQARLICKRFQERMGQQIANKLASMLSPHGVAVYLEAHHLCTQMRGVAEDSPLTRTTVWRGEYENNPDLRHEFFATCGLSR